jgi:hypothetical protein
MIDARTWLLQKLKTLNATVKAGQPEGDLELPLITYSEITNVRVGLWHDQITYQIDAYDGDFDDVVELADKVDELLTPLGFVRTYVSPDSQARIDVNLYHKALSYTVDINTRTNNIYQTT